MGRGEVICPGCGRYQSECICPDEHEPTLTRGAAPLFSKHKYVKGLLIAACGAIIIIAMAIFYDEFLLAWNASAAEMRSRGKEIRLFYTWYPRAVAAVIVVSGALICLKGCRKVKGALSAL